MLRSALRLRERMNSGCAPRKTAVVNSVSRTYRNRRSAVVSCSRTVMAFQMFRPIGSISTTSNPAAPKTFSRPASVASSAESTSTFAALPSRDSTENVTRSCSGAIGSVFLRLQRTTSSASASRSGSEGRSTMLMRNQESGSSSETLSQRPVSLRRRRSVTASTDSFASCGVTIAEVNVSAASRYGLAVTRRMPLLPRPNRACTRASVSMMTTSDGKERDINDDLLDERDLVDLAQSGLSLLHLQQRRFAEEGHAFLVGGFLDLRGRTTIENHGSNTIRKVEKFRDRSTAVKSGAVAFDTPRSFVERPAAELCQIQSRFHDDRVLIFHFALAVFADLAHQALREHAVQRGDEVVEIDLHVQEAAQNVDDVVRVNGGEDEVAGQRRLHGDLRGLFVADLTDHDLVRIVAEDRAQTAREREALLLVDRDLRDAAQLILDRVFDGDDLVFGRLDLGERRVKSGRLTGTGRTGDQHHSVRLLDELAEAGQHPLVEAENVQAKVLELLRHRLLVEDTDDRVFAVCGRNDRNAEVDGAAGDAQLEATVLRHALLRDVQLRHDLDAGNDRGVMALVDRLERFVEHAVDAVLEDRKSVV